MNDPFDPFTKMQRDFERMRDPLGIARYQREMQLPVSVADQLAGAFRVNTSLYDQLQQPHLRSITEQLAGTYSTSRVYETMQRSLTSVELLRTNELANTLSHLSMDAAKLFDKSIYGLSKIHESIAELSRPMSHQLSAARMFEAQLQNMLPSAHMTWMADLERSAMPWLSAHEALWPNDALVLRMLEEQTLGIGSWLNDPIEPNSAPHFALAALSSERPNASTPIEVNLEVCCALCDGPIYTAGATPSWVGPKLDLKIRVVPICATCNERDAEDPGYIREALREMIGAPPTSTRPQLEIFSGDDTDPVPRGALTLVRDDEPVHDE